MGAKFSIMELDDAGYLAGELFRRTFGSALPEYPRHFVTLYESSPGTYRTAGYVHFSPFEGVYLAGGLIADKAVYPSVAKGDLAELGPRPSIGEFTMREGIARLDGAAVFAYIGDPRSVAVNLNVGYVATHVDNLFVFWKTNMPADIQRAVVDRVARLVPF